MNEQYPSIAEQHAELIGLTKDIRQEINTALAPAVSFVAQCVEELVDTDPELVRTAASWPHVDAVPYSCATVPPDLFEITKEPDVFQLPETAEGIDMLLRGYWPYRMQRGPVESPGPQANDTLHRRELRDTLRGMLSTPRIDREDWSAYRQVHKEQQARAQASTGQCNLTYAAARVASGRALKTAIKNGLLEHTTPDAYSTFLITTPNSAYNAVTPARLPIGVQGRKDTECVFRAACFIIDFCEQNTDVHMEVARAVEKHAEVMGDHIYRAIEQLLPGSHEGGVASIQEGALAIAAITALHANALTSLLPKDHEPLDAIVEGNLVNQTARVSPLTVAAAPVLYGRLFPNAAEYTDKASCSRELMQTLASMRSHHTRHHYAAWKQYSQDKETNPNARKPVRTGSSCPLSLPYRHEGALYASAITQLTRAQCKVANLLEPKANVETDHGLPWEGPRLGTSSALPMGSNMYALHQAGTINLLPHREFTDNTPPDTLALKT